MAKQRRQGKAAAAHAEGVDDFWRDHVYPALVKLVELDDERTRMCATEETKGVGGDLAAERAAAVAELEKLDPRVERIWRHGPPSGAPPGITRAYDLLEIAAGLARAGAADRARRRWDEAASVLEPLGDVVHDLGLAWYGARIRRAVEGLPPLAPAEAELARRRRALGRFNRFVLDRLRQSSRVLEPSGDLLDPCGSFVRGDAETEGLELIVSAFDARLHEVSGAGALAVLAAQLRAPEQVRTGDLAHVWEVLVILGPECALGLLAALARVSRGLGETALAAELAGYFERTLPWPERQAPRDAALAVREVALALRAAGQRDRARGLVELGLRELPRCEWPALGAAAAALGRMGAARLAIRGALRRLDDDRSVHAASRLELARHVSDAASWLPTAEAIPLLRHLRPRLSRMHARVLTSFDLHEVAFVDLMVTGLVGERLAVRAAVPR